VDCMIIEQKRSYLLSVTDGYYLLFVPRTIIST